MFFAVNIWLIQGYRDTFLAYKKRKLYDDIVHGSLPIGIGAAAAVSFVVIVFILV